MNCNGVESFAFVNLSTSFYYDMAPAKIWAGKTHAQKKKLFSIFYIAEKLFLFSTMVDGSPWNFNIFIFLLLFGDERICENSKNKEIGIQLGWEKENLWEEFLMEEVWSFDFKWKFVD